jgi:uncharacterized membrane protein (UPF0127 family)
MMKTGKSPILTCYLLLLGLLLLPAPLLAGVEFSEYGNPYTWVTVGQTRVKAEVVFSPGKLYLGLSRRSNLPEGRGMLFIMPGTEVQTFCMREMYFPLDFLWLTAGRVAGITKNVSPQNQQASYCSPVPVKYVLEVSAGFCDHHGIKVGDPASW